MKTKKKQALFFLIIFYVTFHIAYTIFSDWDNFKAGLSGGMPINKEIKK